MGQHDDAYFPRVWVFPTGELITQALSLRSVLSHEEQQARRSLSAIADSGTWLVGHVARRLVLSRLLNSDPAGIRFEYADHPLGACDGKPWCVDAPHLDISLSSTRSLSCLAIARTGLVGVDVEAVPDVSESQEMIDRNTTPGERATLASLPPAAQRAAFVQIWCRKEACAKAVGVGLTIGFDRFSVSERGPDPSEALGPDTRTWSTHDLPMATGYVGAIAFTPSGGHAPPVICVTDLDGA
jgi:4'-phosphopantetheinyl transferase